MSALDIATGQDTANDPAWQPWTSSSVKLVSLRPLVRDGWYNSSPSMTTWGHAIDRHANPGKGWISFPTPYYWIAYRRGTGHSAASRGSLPRVSGGNSCVMVMRSHDLRRWRQVKLFEPPEGVVNGSWIGTSHLCGDDERLYLFLRVHTPREEGVRNRLYLTSTQDGVHWSEPKLATDPDGPFWTWRVRRHNRKFYAAFPHPSDGDSSFDLMVSDDGLQWTRHARIAPRRPDGVKSFTGESDLHWRPDGELWCVERTSNGTFMFWAKQPYTQWQGGVTIGYCDAPAMCASGPDVYLAGRGPVKTTPKPNEIGGKKGTTVVYRLTRGSTELVASFPAGGDASYPGLVSPKPGKLVLSFYSDVAYQTGEIKPKYHGQYGYKLTTNDIYLAEITVDE